MKKHSSRIIAFLFAACVFCIQSAAQDIIVFRTGDEVQAQVVKIGSDNIEYKKWSNVNGPSYEAAKNEIFMIKYQNGDKDVFKETSAPKEKSEPRLIELPVDERNAEIINMYSRSVDAIDFTQLKQKNIAASYSVYFWKIHSQSKLSNSEVEVQIVPSDTRGSSFIPAEKQEKELTNRGILAAGYYINITNKTGKTIYIDKVKCIRINADGMHENYFDKQVQTVAQQKSEGKASVVGGIIAPIGVGSASTTGSVTSTSTEYSDEQILKISPYGGDCLQRDKIVYNENHSENYSAFNTIGGTNYGKHEDFAFSYPKESILRYQVKEYTQENSPYTHRIIVTYSTNEDFSTYSLLELRLYVSNVFGLPYFPLIYTSKNGWAMNSWVTLQTYLKLPNLDWGHCIITGQQH